MRSEAASFLKLWLAFVLIWVVVCVATLRPDRPAALLLHYCSQGEALSCTGHPAEGGVLLAPPSVDLAKKDLLFFALVGLGTPFLVFVMGRAARWAAGGKDGD